MLSEINALRMSTECRPEVRILFTYRLCKDTAIESVRLLM